MSVQIGELTFLELLAPRYKIPTPDFVVEPVTQSVVKKKLAEWGAGIIKPDVLAGKRGKAGLIRKVEDYREAVPMLKKVSAAEVSGRQPRTAYMVQTVDADMEIFSAFTYNSRNLGPSMTVCIHGGMDVESVPDDQKVTVPINAFRGLNAYQASEALCQAGLPQGKLNSQMALCLVKQWDMFNATGMQSCEVNPWRVMNSGKVNACDFKATFDDNSHKFQGLGLEVPEYPTLTDSFEEEMNAWSASSHQGQAHVADLGGELILPMLFGGGAGTIVIETLAQAGGDPMFLSDFGGNPPYERMKKTAEICFRHKLADASLLLILGGKANNTQIDVTFASIADALQEWSDEHGARNIPVIIGRGGPGLVQGFASMKKTLENLGMPYVFFGPDTPLTLVASYAARLAKQVKKETLRKASKSK